MKYKNGSIVLFSGKGFLSWLIKIGTFSRYSHVGIIIDGKLVESTGLSNCRELRKGLLFSGVQEFDIEERIDKYEGKVYIMEQQESRYKLFKDELVQFVNETYWTPYEENWWELLKSGIDWLPSCSEDMSSLFCSEYDAYCLEIMGYIGTEKKMNDYSPKNISKVKGFKKIRRIK